MGKEEETSTTNKFNTSAERKVDMKQINPQGKGITKGGPGQMFVLPI